MTELHDLLQRAAPEPRRPVDVAGLDQRAARQRTRARALGGFCALLVAGAILTVGLTRTGGEEDDRLDTARNEEFAPPDASDGTATQRSSVDLTPVDDTGEVPGRVPVPDGFVDAGSSVGTRTYVADAALARAAAQESRRPRDESTGSGQPDSGLGVESTAMERAEESAVTVAEATIYLENEGGSPSSVTVTVTEGDVYAPELLDVMLEFSPTARSVMVRGRPGVLLGSTDDTTSIAWQEREGLSVYVSVIGADEQWALDYVNDIEA